jgi:RHS repeat-associated protein
MFQSLSSVNLRVCTAILGGVLTLIIAAPVHAQSQVPPPVFPAVDGNSVDVATGAFNYSQTDVAIGQPGSGRLAYTRYYQSAPSPNWTHNHIGYIAVNGTTCSVVIGASTETFTSSISGCTGTFSSNQAIGSSLSYTSGIYTYTTSDGTVAQFSVIGTNVTMLYGVTIILNSITTPTGEVTSYYYDYDSICYPSPEYCYTEIYFGRLELVYNNFGYILWFDYPSHPVNMDHPNKVTGVNLAVEYCVPGYCLETWPYATYTYNSNKHVTAATNALNNSTTYTYSGSSITEVQFPHHADHDINITYASGRVATINPGPGTWSYSYADASGERTTTVTNPDTTTRTYVSTIASGRIKTVTNELSQTLSYQYDAAGRQTRVTQPEGNYTQYTYDSRGNITQTRRVSKTQGTPADIVTTATYPSSCTNQKTCNQPTSTTDARGYRTDYTYNSTHGGVLTMTPPAPSGGTPVGSGARPQSRFTYAQFQARYQIASGWTNGAQVWRLTATSACATAAPACLGTYNETVTTLAYPGSGTPNNVLPSSTTTRAGDSAVSTTTDMTYTSWGDLKTVDGPLSGSADTTRFYYDGAGRPVGVVGPDPDGSLKYRAQRTTYNSVDQVTVVERGTVTNQSDSAFSTFTLLEKQDTAYDTFGRPVRARLMNGASIIALTQFNYTNRNQPLCTTVRMNPATFASPPGACTLGTQGSDGPDRITRNVYDAAGRISQAQSAYGTALAQTTAAYTYTANGQVATLTDARSYMTTYEYDGFDRLKKRRYPKPGTVNDSSTSDYEQLTYDAYGRLTQERRRSGDSFVFSYDNLDRVTLRNAPDTQPDVTYGYDLLGRVSSESQTGNTLTTAYNALSRVTSVTSSVLGAVSYQYDAAGRRTRMDYPGSFYVTYEYNTAGDLNKIKENDTTTLATYGYDDLGRRKSLTRGNNVVTTNYTYDAASRLATLVQNPAGTSHDTTFTFSYNPAGQITSRTRSNGIYDWVLPAGFNESYTRNGLNQYTNVGGDTLSYDTRGNLTDDGILTYGYDYDNKLISASGVTLSYDPAGRLHQIGTTTRFLYDGADVIAEYTTSGAVQKRYVHGPGADEPLVWYEGSGVTNKSYLLADERGTVIGITNNSGAVTQVNKYDEYGVPADANQGRFQYTGQLWLDEIGLYHYKARAYHPWLGRFMQTDPIGYTGGMNLYAYVGNDPVNRTDPSGLTWIEEILVTGHRPDDCPRFANCWGVSGSMFPIPVPYIGTPNIQIPYLPGSGPAPGDGKGNKPPKAPPPDSKTCTFTALFSAVGPNQATGIGALGFSPPYGSVAISPSIFGFAYDTIPEREAAQRTLRANVPNVRITAPDLVNYWSGPTTFSIGDVGDRNIRNSSVPRFDIYRFNTTADALQFGLRTVKTTVSGMPSTWKCPGE